MKDQPSPIASMNTAPRPGSVVVSEEEIASIVARLGAEISRDYVTQHPILISLLKGGVVFLADLIRRVTIPHHIEFMKVSSYETGARSSGLVRIIDDLSCSIEGRDVLLVEDVIDTGITLAYILKVLASRRPRSIEICTLLRKRVPGQVDVPIRYLGRDIPNYYVVGYGLDYEESFRHLPHIAMLDFQDTHA